MTPAEGIVLGLFGLLFIVVLLAIILWDMWRGFRDD